MINFSPVSSAVTGAGRTGTGLLAKAQTKVTQEIAFKKESSTGHTSKIMRYKFEPPLGLGNWVTGVLKTSDKISKAEIIDAREGYYIINAYASNGINFYSCAVSKDNNVFIKDFPTGSDAGYFKKDMNTIIDFINSNVKDLPEEASSALNKLGPAINNAGKTSQNPTGEEKIIRRVCIPNDKDPATKTIRYWIIAPDGSVRRTSINIAPKNISLIMDAYPKAKDGGYSADYYVYDHLITKNDGTKTYNNRAYLHKFVREEGKRMDDPATEGFEDTPLPYSNTVDMKAIINKILENEGNPEYRVILESALKNI